MSKSRRYRVLTAEERRLWAHVAHGVMPLKGRALPAPEPPQSDPAPRPNQEPPQVPAPAPRRSALPPLAALERKTLIGLRRGTRSVDAVIDLHGRRQAEAHAALTGFLRRSHQAGHQVVLVITGKGGAGSGDAVFEERGVLRRVVPHWLRLPDLRPLVVGFETAAPHHGGSGALYVRLRRSKGGEGRP